MKFNALVTILLIASFGRAEARNLKIMGNEAGNGGEVVLCKCTTADGTGIFDTAEMLDYFEGHVLRGNKVDLGPATLPYDQKVVMAIQRLQNVSPLRAQLYMERAQSFMAETALIPNIVLPNTADSGFSVLPKNCTLQQIAVQRRPQFSDEARYVISKDLWDLLDNDGKAGLVLHELFYREAIEYGQTTSESARYLNSYFSDAKSESLTVPAFIQILVGGKYLKTDVQGYQLAVAPKNYPEFYPSGELHSAMFYSEEPNAAPGTAYVVLPGLTPVGKTTKILDRVEFYPSGHFSRIRVAGQLMDNSLEIQNQLIDVAGPRPVEIYDSGSLKSALLFSRFHFTGDQYDLRGVTTDVSFREDGKLLRCSGCEGIVTFNGKSVHVSSVEFYDSGAVRSMSTERSSVNILVQGKTYPFDGSISLFEDGSVRSAFSYTSAVAFNILVGNVPLQFESFVEFYDPNTLKSGKIRADYILSAPDGTAVKIAKGERVSFDQNGRVLSHYMP